MSRVLRAMVYMVLIVVGYHCTLALAERHHSPSVEFLRAIGHHRGLSLAWAGACVATGEFGLLAASMLLLVLTSWPVDVVALSFALASGGLVGAAIRSFVQTGRERKQDAR